MKDSRRHRKTCRDLINSEKEGRGKWRDMGETTQSILVTVKSCLEVSISGGGKLTSRIRVTVQAVHVRLSEYFPLL